MRKVIFILLMVILVNVPGIIYAAQVDQPDYSAISKRIVDNSLIIHNELTKLKVDFNNYKNKELVLNIHPKKLAILDKYSKQLNSDIKILCDDLKSSKMSEIDLFKVIHNFDKHLNSLPNIKIFVKQLKFYALSNENISSQLKSELCSLIDGYQDILKANKFNVLFLTKCINKRDFNSMAHTAATIVVGGYVAIQTAHAAYNALQNHTGPTNAAGSMAHDAINGTNHHNDDDTNEASVSSSHDSSEIEVNNDTSEVQNN